MRVNKSSHSEICKHIITNHEFRGFGKDMREAGRLVLDQFNAILALVGLLWGSVWSSIGPLEAIMPFIGYIEAA